MTPTIDSMRPVSSPPAALAASPVTGPRMPAYTEAPDNDEYFQLRVKLARGDTLDATEMEKYKKHRIRALQPGLELRAFRTMIYEPLVNGEDQVSQADYVDQIVNIRNMVGMTSGGTPYTVANYYEDLKAGADDPRVKYHKTKADFDTAAKEFAIADAALNNTGLKEKLVAGSLNVITELKRRYDTAAVFLKNEAAPGMMRVTPGDGGMTRDKAQRIVNTLDPILRSYNSGLAKQAETEAPGDPVADALTLDDPKGRYAFDDVYKDLVRSMYRGARGDATWRQSLGDAADAARGSSLVGSSLAYVGALSTAPAALLGGYGARVIDAVVPDVPQRPDTKYPEFNNRTTWEILSQGSPEDQTKFVEFVGKAMGDSSLGSQLSAAAMYQKARASVMAKKTELDTMDADPRIQAYTKGADAATVLERARRREAVLTPASSQRGYAPAPIVMPAYAASLPPKDRARLQLQIDRANSTGALQGAQVALREQDLRLRERAAAQQNASAQVRDALGLGQLGVAQERLALDASKAYSQEEIDRVRQTVIAMADYNKIAVPSGAQPVDPRNQEEFDQFYNSLHRRRQ